MTVYLGADGAVPPPAATTTTFVTDVSKLEHLEKPLVVDIEEVLCDHSTQQAYSVFRQDLSRNDHHLFSVYL